VVCWTDRCDDKLLWRSVHRLGTQHFSLPVVGECEGLWGVLNPNLDCAALWKEIRTKALFCLRHLTNGEPTVATPTFYCCNCDEFAFVESGRTCDCAAVYLSRNEEVWWHHYWTRSPPYFNFLVRSDNLRGNPWGLRWPNIRMFVIFFLEWCSFSKTGWQDVHRPHLGCYGGWLRFACIDGDGILLHISLREHAELFLGTDNYSLYNRSLQCLMREGFNVRQSELLANSPHKEKFQIQLDLSRLPVCE
jgi:hypothetical protein